MLHCMLWLLQAVSGPAAFSHGFIVGYVHALVSQPAQPEGFIPGVLVGITTVHRNCVLDSDALVETRAARVASRPPPSMPLLTKPSSHLDPFIQPLFLRLLRGTLRILQL